MAKPRQQFKALIRRRGYTQERLAQEIGVGTSTVRDWCQGVSTPGADNRRALAPPLGLDLDKLDIYLNGNRARPRLRSGFNHFMTLEQSATSFRTWEPILVAGLLQTEDYAAAILAPELVEHRMRRQQALRREPSPLDLTAVLDESVLYRPIGGPAVLGGQLRHLVAMAREPNVKLHVLPFDAPEQPMSFGACVILGFEDWGDGGCVYQHNRSDVALYLDDGDHVDVHIAAYEMLIEMAYSPDESIDRITTRAKELGT